MRSQNNPRFALIVALASALIVIAIVLAEQDPAARTFMRANLWTYGIAVFALMGVGSGLYGWVVDNLNAHL